MEQAMTFTPFTENCLMTASDFIGDAAWRRLAFLAPRTAAAWHGAHSSLLTDQTLAACTCRHLNESMLLSEWQGAEHWCLLFLPLQSAFQKILLFPPTFSSHNF